jgi:hypothetical protein
MRKYVYALTLIAAMALPAFGQDIQKVANAKAEVADIKPPDSAKGPWRVHGSGSLQFTQASFSNWSAGGQNSLGLVCWLNFKANYRKGRHVWANNVDLGYGFNILGKGSSAQYNKTNDKIEITTAYAYDLDKNQHWYFTLLANFRSQFDKGYNNPDDKVVISKFMAPGYLVAGFGITYAPVTWFNVYLSPASGRFTFVMDKALSDSGAFGVERGKNIRGELGPYLRGYINKDLSTNINLTSTVELFTDYLKDFGNIDVNWSLLLSLKVNKWLATAIQTQLIYDNDVMIQSEPGEAPGPRTQFKELFGIGLTYKIN